MSDLEALKAFENGVHVEIPTENIKKYNFWDKEDQIEILCLQYQKHGQIIIAVDFDDTVYDSYHKGKDFTPVHSLLKRAKAIGCKLMIFTARNETEFFEVIEHYNDIGIEYDTLNDDIIILNSGKSRKPYFNILLDDKAGLMESFLVLEEFVKITEKQIELKNKNENKIMTGVNQLLVKEMVKNNTKEYNLLKFLEEMAEINEVTLKFLTKNEKFRPPVEKFHEELSHLKLRLAVMEEIFGVDEVAMELNKKQNAIASRIGQNKKNDL